jgi:hypothetical protein
MKFILRFSTRNTPEPIGAEARGANMWMRLVTKL